MAPPWAGSADANLPNGGEKRRARGAANELIGVSIVISGLEERAFKRGQTNVWFRLRLAEALAHLAPLVPVRADLASVNLTLDGFVDDLRGGAGPIV